MPQINGIEFIARLKEDTRLRTLPIAMMSGSCKEALPAILGHQVAVPHLAKAVTWNELHEFARVIYGVLVERAKTTLAKEVLNPVAPTTTF